MWINSMLASCLDLSVTIVPGSASKICVFCRCSEQHNLVHLIVSLCLHFLSLPKCLPYVCYLSESCLLLLHQVSSFSSVSFFSPSVCQIISRTMQIRNEKRGTGCGLGWKDLKFHFQLCHRHLVGLFASYFTLLWTYSLKAVSDSTL